MGSAHSAVRSAVQSGKLPPVTKQRCADCGQPAVQYHHFAGYEREHWLDVVALCHSCHRLRTYGPRPADGRPGYVVFKIDPDVRVRLEAAAARTGYSLTEVARRCLRVGTRFTDDFEPRPTGYAIEPRPRRSRKSAAIPA